MLPSCLSKIRQALSDPRLDAYRVHPTEDELDLFARHAWNMALGASLYVPIQLLEVALRNSLYRTLTQHHGGNEYWYRLRQAFPPAFANRPDSPWSKAQRAVRKVARNRAPAPNEPGRVVAALDLGFWTSLLSSPFGSPASVRHNWNPPWPTLVTFAFPHFPNPTGTGRDRRTLAQRFDDIRQLRNRISHHEPIWKGRTRPRGGQRATLAEQYDEIIEAIGWISPEVRDTVMILSTFHQVHSAGPSRYRTMLESLP